MEAAKELYFVHRLNGKITRLAKIEKLSKAYGFVDGKWEYMPGLIKIVYDNTDYEEITKEEAEKIMDQLK